MSLSLYLLFISTVIVTDVVAGGNQCDLDYMFSTYQWYCHRRVCWTSLDLFCLFGVTVWLL